MKNKEKNIRRVVLMGASSINDAVVVMTIQR